MRVGNEHRACFGLILSQVEQAIQLLEMLEAKGEAKSLPDVGVGQDSVIFTSALADFKRRMMSA